MSSTDIPQLNDHHDPIPRSDDLSRSQNKDLLSVPDIWRKFSSELSYIDVSRHSSIRKDSYIPPTNKSRSVSWNLDHHDNPLETLEVQDKKLSSLLRPSLLRYGSDSVCYNSHKNKNNVLEVSVSNDLHLETRVQKRLSFGDILDTSTKVYTPDESDHSFAWTGSWSQRECRDSCHSIDNPHEINKEKLQDGDNQSQYSLYMEHDLRYYFQHPYPRLFIAYFVIFCNFLIFAEDPISHSYTESSIPVMGNVFSFILTKYPPEWYWKMIKVMLWLVAMSCGMLIGKVVIHGLLLKRILRLKMFRDDQGSWMIMFLTVIVALYMFSHVYNMVLLLGYYNHLEYEINNEMAVSNSSVMKAAACGTWLGDLITAWMVTDMMLQDNLYPHWAPRIRRFWRNNDNLRIMIFWLGSITATSMVVTLIVSDWISWDRLNRDFVATTELSRAFLASFILVMDLIILMQDWDFPHFTTTLNVNLPGFKVAFLKFEFFQIHITGKWFNYGIILVVMLLDLNMWKNQIFYSPVDFGQYIDIHQKIYSVMDEKILETLNATLWTYELRSLIDPNTSRPFYEDDMMMNSRFMNYSMSAKWTAFLPSVMAFVLFGVLVFLYGRFPPNEDGTHGGRLKKRKRRSSWKRERHWSSPQKRLMVPMWSQWGKTPV